MHRVEQPIPNIPYPRYDVSLLIETGVDCTHDKVGSLRPDLGCFFQSCPAGEDRDESDVLNTPVPTEQLACHTHMSVSLLTAESQSPPQLCHPWQSRGPRHTPV